MTLKEHWPRYVKMDEAREILGKMGIELTKRQIQRAARRTLLVAASSRFLLIPLIRS